MFPPVVFPLTKNWKRGSTLSVAVFTLPSKDAVTVTEVVNDPTALVATVKVALLAPSGTVTVAGTETTEGLLLDKEIVAPPRLLLVDEPSVGMAPKIAAEVYELLVQLPGWGITVLLVDQNITDAVRIAARVYLLGEGRVQREGSGAWFHSHVEEVIREMLQGGA